MLSSFSSNLPTAFCLRSDSQPSLALKSVIFFSIFSITSFAAFLSQRIVNL